MPGAGRPAAAATDGMRGHGRSDPPGCARRQRDGGRAGRRGPAARLAAGRAGEPGGSGPGGPAPAAVSGTGLRLARQARGFSQQQLAGMAGVSRQAVSAVESGVSDPSLRVALALAHALGMTVEELFGPGQPGAAGHGQPAGPAGPARRPGGAGAGRGRAGRPAAVRRDRHQGRLPARRRPGRAGPGSRPPAGRGDGQLGPADRAAAAHAGGRRLRSGAAAASRRRWPCSTRRWRSPGGRAPAARRSASRPTAWCTWPACTCATTDGEYDTGPASDLLRDGAEIIRFCSWREGLVLRPGPRRRHLRRRPTCPAPACGWSTGIPAPRPAGCWTGSWPTSAWTRPACPATTPRRPATWRSPR